MEDQELVECPVVDPMNEEGLAGPMDEEMVTAVSAPVQEPNQRQRYIYDIANPSRAMRHLLEDLAHVREILKYLESPECRNDMDNDQERIREHIKDHTVIFKGLLSTKERLETIVVSSR